MVDQLWTVIFVTVVVLQILRNSIKSSCKHNYSSLRLLVWHGRPFFRCLLAPMKIWFGQSSIRYLSYYNIRLCFSFHILIAPIEMYRKCGLPKSGLKFNWPLDKIGLKMANYYLSSACASFNSQYFKLLQSNEDSKRSKSFGNFLKKDSLLVF